jgi:adenylate cyclase
VGSPAEGLVAVADGRATAARTGERFYTAELHRLQEELLRRPGSDPNAADRCLLKAIDLARGQGARWLELRAVVSPDRVHPED